MQVKYLLLCKGYLNITSALLPQTSATSSVEVTDDLAISQQTWSRTRGHVTLTETLQLSPPRLEGRRRTVYPAEL